MNVARRQRLLIVGGGMAAGRLLDRLLERGYPGTITLAGEETEAAYNRVLLPGLLAGANDRTALLTKPRRWFADHGVDARLGQPVARLDPDAGAAHLQDGSQLDFDRVVLCVGARVPTPAIAGIDLAGVVTLRSLADSDALARLAAAGRRALVVGGGLLGLETAQALLDRGVQVTVAHRNAALLNRQLDPVGSAMLASALQSRGMLLRLAATPVALHGEGRVTAVTLSDGASLDTDLVVLATGTRPNDALAAGAGLCCAEGIAVDAQLRTSHPNVFALGECARVDGVSYALVEPVFRQADVLADVLCNGSATFLPPPPATRLKVSGIELFSAGQIHGGDDREEVCIRDPGRGLYRRLRFHGQRLVGAVLLGDITGSRLLQEQIESARPVSAPGARVAMAFGAAVAESAGAEAA